MTGFSFPQSTAAVSWVDDNGIAQAHVYSCDGNMVSERYWSGSGWLNGTLSAKAEHIAATAYYLHGDPYIRVYCTYEGVTTEYCSDAGSAWYQGSYSPS